MAIINGPDEDFLLFFSFGGQDQATPPFDEIQGVVEGHLFVFSVPVLLRFSFAFYLRR